MMAGRRVRVRLVPMPHPRLHRVLLVGAAEAGDEFGSAVTTGKAASAEPTGAPSNAHAGAAPDAAPNTHATRHVRLKIRITSFLVRPA